MIIYECDQRSPEWFALRCGRLTSSRANDMLAVPRKEGAGLRHDLKWELALETVTRKPQGPDFSSRDMDNGRMREADGRDLYAARTGTLLYQTGFLAHDEMMAGASLDGHTAEFDGLVEAKCPKAKTHGEFLRTSQVPTDYLRQITHQLWIVEQAEWCDYISYHPDFPERLQLKIVRVNRADVDVTAYGLAARLFLKEVAALAAEVEGMAA